MIHIHRAVINFCLRNKLKTHLHGKPMHEINTTTTWMNEKKYTNFSRCGLNSAPSKMKIIHFFLWFVVRRGP